MGQIMQVTSSDSNAIQVISRLNSSNLSIDQKFNMIAQVLVAGVEQVEDLNQTTETLKREVSELKQKNGEITTQLHTEKKRRLTSEAEKTVEAVKKVIQDNERNESIETAKFVTTGTSSALAISTLPIMAINPLLGLISVGLAIPAIGCAISKQFDTPSLSREEVAELKIKEFVFKHFPEAAESEDILARAKAIGKQMYEANFAYDETISRLKDAITEAYVDDTNSKADRQRKFSAHYNQKIEGAKAKKELEKVKAEVNGKIKELQAYIKTNFYKLK